MIVKRNYKPKTCEYQGVGCEGIFIPTVGPQIYCKNCAPLARKEKTKKRDALRRCTPEYRKKLNTQQRRRWANDSEFRERRKAANSQRAKKKRAENPGLKPKICKECGDFLNLMGLGQSIVLNV